MQPKGREEREEREERKETAHEVRKTLFWTGAILARKRSYRLCLGKRRSHPWAGTAAVHLQRASAGGLICGVAGGADAAWTKGFGGIPCTGIGAVMGSMPRVATACHMNAQILWTAMFKRNASSCHRFARDMRDEIRNCPTNRVDLDQGLGRSGASRRMGHLRHLRGTTWQILSAIYNRCLSPAISADGARLHRRVQPFRWRIGHGSQVHVGPDGQAAVRRHIIITRSRAHLQRRAQRWSTSAQLSGDSQEGESACWSPPARPQGLNQSMFADPGAPTCFLERPKSKASKATFLEASQPVW